MPKSLETIKLLVENLRRSNSGNGITAAVEWLRDDIYGIDVDFAQLALPPGYKHYVQSDDPAIVAVANDSSASIIKAEAHSVGAALCIASLLAWKSISDRRSSLN